MNRRSQCNVCENLFLSVFVNIIYNLEIVFNISVISELRIYMTGSVIGHGRGISLSLYSCTERLVCDDVSERSVRLETGLLPEADVAVWSLQGTT